MTKPDVLTRILSSAREFEDAIRVYQARTRLGGTAKTAEELEALEIALSIGNDSTAKIRELVRTASRSTPAPTTPELPLFHRPPVEDADLVEPPIDDGGHPIDCQTGEPRRRRVVGGLRDLLTPEEAEAATGISRHRLVRAGNLSAVRDELWMTVDPTDRNRRYFRRGNLVQWAEEGAGAEIPRKWKPRGGAVALAREAEATGWMTAKTAAELLGVSTSTISRYARKNVLSSRRIPGGRLFNPADVERMASATTEKTT